MEYLVTFLFLFGSHYVEFDHLLPWQMRNEDGSPTSYRFIVNYMIGTVGMLAPFAWKLWVRDEVDLLISLGLFVVTAGLAPMIAYANDAWKKTKQKAEEQAEQAALLRSQRDAKPER